MASVQIDKMKRKSNSLENLEMQDSPMTQLQTSSKYPEPQSGTTLQESIQSPFLEGTWIQYAIDSTSLDWFKRCPRLYQYSMIEGWIPNEESANLRFGLEFHQALQEYDIAKAEGGSHQSILRRVLRSLLQRTENWDSDHKYKNRHLLTRTVLWYLDHFQEDPASTYILANGRPAVELSFRFELDWGPVSGVKDDWKEVPLKEEVSEDKVYKQNFRAQSQPYLLCGHLDRIVTFNDELFVMDHKTTTQTPGSYYFNQFEPNNQMTLYTIASQVVINSPVKGVIIDCTHILVDSVRPGVRSFTYRTKDQLEEWLLDLRYWLGKMEEHAIAKYWPMNDTSCMMWGGCKFRKVCSRSPQVREQILKAEYTKRESWNPLRSREVK